MADRPDDSDDLRILWSRFMFDFLEDDDFDHGWDQAESMVSEAFELYEKGQMEQAFEKLNGAIELRPEHSEWYFNAALTLDGLEEYEKAIKFYERALECDSDDVEILNCLGVNYTRTACYDLALNTFEHIEAIQPDFEPAYCNRIIAYTEMEQHDKAEQMFYLAQQINPDCPLCFYNIGNSLFTQGRYERAIWCWDKCAELDPNHPQIHFRLAQVCWVSGQGRRARQEFLAEVCQNPTDLDIILDFGIFLLESGDLEGAKEKFNRILEFDETFTLARFYLAEVYLMQGSLSAAVHWYQQAMDADETLTGSRFRLAQIYKQKGDCATAKDFLEREYQLGIEDDDVLNATGWMFLEMGHPENAFNCFLRLLEQGDSDGNIFFGLTMSLVMKGEYESGLMSLRQAMRLSPTKPEMLLCAGWICYKLKKWPQALCYLRKCQNLFPGSQPWQSRCCQLKRAVIFKKIIRKATKFVHRIKKSVHC